MLAKQEYLLFCSNSEGTMNGDTSSTPHYNAIQQGDVGLGVLGYQVVHCILMGEEAAQD